MKRDLVVFGEDWASLPSSTQHLIKHIAHTRKIIWINSIGLRKPKLTLDDFRRAFKKILMGLIDRINKKYKNEEKNRHSEVNIYTHTLISLPAPVKIWERYIVKKVLARQLRPLISQHGLNHIAIWTSLPTASDLIDEFPNTPYIYYCGDDFSGLVGVDHDTAILHEKKIGEKCDLIISSSKSLAKKFPEKKSQYLSHGVDISLFSKTMPLAEDFPTSGNPIAGFYGSISSWLDIDFLVIVITKMKTWDFVFIGDIHVDVSALKSLKNVHFLGKKDHNELPGYSQHWQASLLPFIDNAQIRACNPLKLKEYLAAGPPIISTSFPAANNYDRYIAIVNSPEQMCDTLTNIASETSESKTIIRKHAIHGESWAEKAHTVTTWIDAL